MTINIGQKVLYVDEYGKAHDALVTQVWHQRPAYTAGKPDLNRPGINLVTISTDENKDDPYGRQIERHASIVHIDYQPAKANCWKEYE